MEEHYKDNCKNKKRNMNTINAKEKTQNTREPTKYQENNNNNGKQQKYMENNIRIVV